MENEIISILDESIKVKEGVKELAPLIRKISEEIIKAYKNKKKDQFLHDWYPPF